MNKIVALINSKNFSKTNVSEIFCPNKHYPNISRHRCKNCGSFICKDCTKNDYTKCVMCSQNYEMCYRCECKIRKYMCHLCGKIITRCSLLCYEDMGTFIPNCDNGNSCYSCYIYDVKCNFCKN